MDRNGKKPKKAQPDASANAERSDTKASARDAPGGAGARPGAQEGKGRGKAPSGPASSGRKGDRG